MVGDEEQPITTVKYDAEATATLRRSYESVRHKNVALSVTSPDPGPVPGSVCPAELQQFSK